MPALDAGEAIVDWTLSVYVYVRLTKRLKCSPPGGEVYTFINANGNFDSSCCAQPEQLTDADANGNRICCPPNQSPSG